MTGVALTGWPALVVLAVFVALWLFIVWVAAVLVNDWWQDWVDGRHDRKMDDLEAGFRQQMAEYGHTPEEIDAQWDEVKRQDWP